MVITYYIYIYIFNILIFFWSFIYVHYINYFERIFTIHSWNHLDFITICHYKSVFKILLIGFILILLIF
jgi:hypothetical protein